MVGGWIWALAQHGSASRWPQSARPRIFDNAALLARYKKAAIGSGVEPRTEFRVDHPFGGGPVLQRRHHYRRQRKYHVGVQIHRQSQRYSENCAKGSPQAMRACSLAYLRRSPSGHARLRTGLDMEFGAFTAGAGATGRAFPKRSKTMARMRLSPTLGSLTRNLLARYPRHRQSGPISATRPHPICTITRLISVLSSDNA